MASFWERTLSDDNSMLSRLLQRYEDAGGVNWFTRTALSNSGVNWYTRNIYPWRIRELVTNGDFADTSAWFVPTPGPVITGGKLDYSTPGVSTTTYQEIDITPGETYTVTFTVEAYVLGTIRVSLGGTLAPNRFANGTYTETLVAGSTNSRISLVSNGNADFNIDDVSVMRV